MQGTGDRGGNMLGLEPRLVARSHVSTGLGTMLFGVSGKCDDREVTSLPDEFPNEPDSENDTCNVQDSDVKINMFLLCLGYKCCHF
jgi:hypothetical protein